MKIIGIPHTAETIRDLISHEDYFHQDLKKLADSLTSATEKISLAADKLISEQPTVAENRVMKTLNRNIDSSEEIVSNDIFWRGITSLDDLVVKVLFYILRI